MRFFCEPWILTVVCLSKVRKYKESIIYSCVPKNTGIDDALYWRMNFVPHQIQVTTGSLALYLELFHPPLPSVSPHHLCSSSSPFLSRHRCWRSRLHTLRLTFHGSTLPWIILAGVCFAFLDDIYRSNNEDLVALGYLHTEVHHSIDPRAKKASVVRTGLPSFKPEINRIWGKKCF